jgi:uncharacterized protein YPO0396
MDDVKIVMWYILVRLKNMKKWGGAHSELKRVLKSLPSHIFSGRKLVDKALKELKNLEFISVYKKTGEDHTSLNPRKVKEINEFIEEIKEEMEGNDYAE